jgi:uncharacterized protein with HEPN domain
MNDKALRWRDYLNHILQALERIERYTGDMTEAEFLKDANSLTQDAVIRNFEIIGEASRNLERHCPEFVAEHPDLPLLNAYEMRNALSHGYFRVDFEIIWKTIQNDLPKLHEQLAKLVENAS